jgi:hypothetical protein
MRVKSAVDRRLKIVFWTALVIIVGAIIIAPTEKKLIISVIGVPCLILITSIFWGTYYELRETYLYCRSGPFTQKIDYDKIKSLRAVEDSQFTMALSSQRIEIKQRDKGTMVGTTLISPVDRESFLAEFTSRCYHLDKTKHVGK